MRSHTRMVVLPLGLLAVTLAVAGQIAAGCVFDLEDNCTRTFGFGCPGLRGATSGGGATGSASTMTGGGGPAGCTDAAECQVPAGLCASLGTATCADHTCVVTYEVGPSPSQQYGSCATNWCDETGTPTLVPDAGNVFDDGNPCVQYPCAMGTVGMGSATPQPDGTPCLQPGGTAMGYCTAVQLLTGIYFCAPCDPNSSSPTCGAGYGCAKGQCVPNHCTNKMFDPSLGETGLDCGGACLPCGTNGGCMLASDCANGICTSNVCPPPSCSDHVQNGYETYPDCGGATCLPCANNATCSLPSDCTSGVCLPTGPGLPDRCAAPTCFDGVQNGGETGIDCGGVGSDGGSLCLPCAM